MRVGKSRVGGCVGGASLKASAHTGKGWSAILLLDTPRPGRTHTLIVGLYPQALYLPQ